MKPQELRLAVGGSGIARSGIWKFWSTRTGDVYIACREMRGGFKVSIHSSGLCNAGFSSEYAKGTLREYGVWSGSRHIEQWRIVRPVTQPTMAARLFIPGSEVRVLANHEKHSPRITWIPLPSPDKTVCIEVVLARSQDQFRSEDCGRIFTARWALGSGESLWVGHQTIDTPRDVLEGIATQRSGDRIQLDGRAEWNRDHPQGRLLVFGPNIGGWVSFIDAASS